MPAKKKSTDTAANLGFENKLFQLADKLRNNMDAAEYKHVMLGLIFLKYVSDSFEEMRQVTYYVRSMRDVKVDNAKPCEGAPYTGE